MGLYRVFRFPRARFCLNSFQYGTPHFLHFSPKMGKTVTIVLQSSVFYLKEEDAIFC